MKSVVNDIMYKVIFTCYDNIQCCIIQNDGNMRSLNGYCTSHRLWKVM